LFRKAQSEYLKGNWFQTEQLLDEALSICPNDFAARLMRIGVLRRVSRLDEAKREWQIAGALPGAQEWQRELRQAQVRLAGSQTRKSKQETVPADQHAA
jgi:hypothetical protein